MKKLPWILIVLLAIACIVVWFRPHEQPPAEVRVETKIKTVVKVDTMLISAPMAVWQTKAAAAHLKAVSLTTAIPAASYSIWKRCCIWMTAPAAHHGTTPSQRISMSTVVTFTLSPRPKQLP